MTALRPFLHRNALAVWLLIACALLMKAVVPSGFMPVMTANGLEIVLCPGVTADASAGAMPGMMHHAMPAIAKQDGRTPAKQAPAKAETPCAFAGLTLPGLGGVDIVLLVIAVAAIVAAGLFFQPIAPIARSAFLRPPLRGPPVHR
ncbi:hypothetical protein [Sphingomonas sp. CARO-RG-8B-R24-01]|uniref:hypothetical protein n=1 Tax=Sphingomonas sp. CARO-RG-8B-R24-01 TaxID=2914831 RepID=UPI001F58B62F|nr:hypothetical protein [Sphingomonas sp. CARO-RG-8B-R24-01]